MTTQTQLDIDKAKLRKTIMAAIRLKHSLNADQEIKTRGAELYQQAEKLLLAGKPVSKAAAELMDVV